MVSGLVHSTERRVCTRAQSAPRKRRWASQRRYCEPLPPLGQTDAVDLRVRRKRRCLEDRQGAEHISVRNA